jgi:hypothetical protein
MKNLLGIDFVPAAGCHAASGALCGSLICGREPISCSSKHSSAIGFEVNNWELSVEYCIVTKGRDTVVELWLVV